MSTGPCCQSFSLHHPPLIYRVCVKALQPPRPTDVSLHRSLRFIGSLSCSPTTRSRLSCFRHEESSSAIPEFELVEDKLSELVKPELNQKDYLRKDWLWRLKKVIAALFDAEPWIVPWTAKTIVQVMLLWIASFWFVGSWIVPIVAHIAGFRKESLTYRGQALYSLLTDLAEGLAGIAMLRRCLSRFHPLPSDWFKFSLEGKWQFDVGLGCLMFPLINRLSQINLNLLPVLPSTPVAISSVEQSIVSRDPVAMALYAVVVSVCAPIWEEIVFRGFLLPSLSKYMPIWCSILPFATNLNSACNTNARVTANVLIAAPFHSLQLKSFYTAVQTTIILLLD